MPVEIMLRMQPLVRKVMLAVFWGSREEKMLLVIACSLLFCHMNGLMPTVSLFVNMWILTRIKS